MRPDGAPIEFPYDSLIVAAGAGQSYFGHDEFSRWAPGMKTINDALELRGRILGAFEMAELEADPAKRQEWLTFVVVGGGPTGVEIAGQIAELSRRVLKDDFREIDPRNAKILLFDGGKEVLATFGDRLSGKAARGLERLGIELHMSSIVTDIDRTGVVVKHGDEERRIPARTKVWAAGVQASPLARMLGEATGAEVDRAGAYQRAPRLHAARAPGGVRDRRHDVPRRSARASPRWRCSRDSTPPTRSSADCAARSRSRSATGTSAAWRPSPGSERWSASRASASPVSSAGWRGSSST